MKLLYETDLFLSLESLKQLQTKYIFTIKFKNLTNIQSPTTS